MSEVDGIVMMTGNFTWTPKWTPYNSTTHA